MTFDLPNLFPFIMKFSLSAYIKKHKVIMTSEETIVRNRNSPASVHPARSDDCSCSAGEELSIKTVEVSPPSDITVATMNMDKISSWMVVCTCAVCSYVHTDIHVYTVYNNIWALPLYMYIQIHSICLWSLLH